MIPKGLSDNVRLIDKHFFYSTVNENVVAKTNVVLLSCLHILRLT